MTTPEPTTTMATEHLSRHLRGIIDETIAEHPDAPPAVRLQARATMLGAAMIAQSIENCFGHNEGDCNVLFELGFIGGKLEELTEAMVARGDE